MGCGGDEPQGGAVTAASLKRDGAKIAVVTGTAAMTAAENYFGKEQCLYFDTPPVTLSVQHDYQSTAHHPYSRSTTARHMVEHHPFPPSLQRRYFGNQLCPILRATLVIGTGRRSDVV